MSRRDTRRITHGLSGDTSIPLLDIIFAASGIFLIFLLLYLISPTARQSLDLPDAIVVCLPERRLMWAERATKRIYVGDVDGARIWLVGIAEATPRPARVAIAFGPDAIDTQRDFVSHLERLLAMPAKSPTASTTQPHPPNLKYVLWPLSGSDASVEQLFERWRSELEQAP